MIEFIGLNCYQYNYNFIWFKYIIIDFKAIFIEYSIDVVYNWYGG